jgi:hypothetical protein
LLNASVASAGFGGWAKVSPWRPCGTSIAARKSRRAVASPFS